MTTFAELASKTQGFFSRHPKATMALAALLLLLCGFAGGRFSGTAQTIEKTKTVTEYKDRLVYQDHIVEKKIYVEVEKKHEHVDTVETKKPDGTVVTETKSDTDTNTGINQTTDTDSTHTITETKYVTQIVEHEKLVLKAPDWRVYAGVGVSLPYYIGQGSVGLPLSGFVVQLGADRRMVGPIWFGLFANTQGTLGLNLSAVF